MHVSFRSHIYRQFFLLSLLTTVVLIAVVDLVYEDIEQNMLSLEMKNELAHHLGKLGDVAEIWQTATTISAYAPRTLASFPKLPKVFAGLDIPFSGEIDAEDKTFWVEIVSLQEGVLYIARDITLFEQREALFVGWSFVVAVLFVLFNILLAVLSARRIVKPLSQLTQDISRMSPDECSSRIVSEYRDQELVSIATTVNSYLEAIEHFVKREQLLIGMASHELRTPIAVVSGALDILDERGSLNDKDKKTLARIREATNEMNANVETILMLVRKRASTSVPPSSLLSSHIQSVVEEQAEKHPGAGTRIVVVPGDLDHEVRGEVTLIRMLLRNLIQNALEHTQGVVTLQQNQAGLQIWDEGEGLPNSVRSRLGQLTPLLPGQTNESGLGLFIVTLICERLGWRIELDPLPAVGTRFQLYIDHQKESIDSRDNSGFNPG